MAASTRNLRRLFWSTFAVFAVLLVLPWTGWLLRAQWRALYSPPPALALDLRGTGINNVVIDPGSPDHELARLNQIAALHPNDFAMQISAAILTGPGGCSPTACTRVDRLHALIIRYPDRPDLYAHLIRFMTEGPILVNQQFGRGGSADNRLFLDRPADPKILRQFEQSASCGERLDPENAYFPMMSAVGLFAAHQDQAALAAIRRASHKSYFNDYVFDEVQANLRLAAAADGQLTGLNRAAVMGQTLLPQYSALNGAARMAAELAIRAEQAGHIADGIAIRHALTRCGGLMRANSTCIMGADLGAIMTRRAEVRPGGAPSRFFGDEVTGSKWSGLDEAAYLSYLNHVGARREAVWTRREMAATDQVLNIARTYFSGPKDGNPVGRLIVWWIFDLTLLSIGLCFLLLAGIARLRWKRPDGFAPLLTALAALGALGIAAWQWPWTGALANLTSIFSTGNAGSIAPVTVLLGVLTDPNGVRPLCVVMVVGLPTILLLHAGATAILRRRPLAGGILGSLRGPGLVIGCTLLLIYAGLAIGTLHVEQIATRSMNQRAQHEGQYFARQLGVKWPTTP